jgi:hypothetical protein
MHKFGSQFVLYNPTLSLESCREEKKSIKSHYNQFFFAIEHLISIQPMNEPIYHLRRLPQISCLENEIQHRKTGSIPSNQLHEIYNINRLNFFLYIFHNQ